jgi:hypothetical protein
MNVARRAVTFLLLVGMAGPLAARQPDRTSDRNSDGTYIAQASPGANYGGAGQVPEPYYAPPAPLQPVYPQVPYPQQPYSRPPYLDTRPGDAFADPPRRYPTPPRHYPTPPRAWPQNNLPQNTLPQNTLPQGNLPQNNFPQNNYRNPRP